MKSGQHRQRLALLVEEEVDDVGRGEHAELLGVELARLAQQLAQDLVAHRARGLHLAAAAAGGAGLAQQVGSDSRVRLRVISTRPSAVKPLMLICAWSRDSVCGTRSSTISRCSTFSMSMKSMMMMLPRLRRRSWRAIAWLASRLVLKMVSSKLRADEAAGVDVDRGHRFGLVDDQVAAGLEVHPAGERLRDFLLDVVELKSGRSPL